MSINHVSHKGLVFRIYAKLLQLNNYKCKRDLNRRYTNVHKAHVRMLNIISHLGNANLNYNGPPFHTG